VKQRARDKGRRKKSQAATRNGPAHRPRVAQSRHPFGAEQGLRTAFALANGGR
jgi:hypothetical protein